MFRSGSLRRPAQSSNSGARNIPSSAVFTAGTSNANVISIEHPGLVNMGNTCFLNSVLQSLSSSAPLVKAIENPPTDSPILNGVTSESLKEGEKVDLGLSIEFLKLVRSLADIQNSGIGALEERKADAPEILQPQSTVAPALGPSIVRDPDPTPSPQPKPLIVDSPAPTNTILLNVDKSLPTPIPGELSLESVKSRIITRSPSNETNQLFSPEGKEENGRWVAFESIDEPIQDPSENDVELKNKLLEGIKDQLVHPHHESNSIVSKEPSDGSPVVNLVVNLTEPQVQGADHRVETQVSAIEPPKPKPKERKFMNLDSLDPYASHPPTPQLSRQPSPNPNKKVFVPKALLHQIARRREEFGAYEQQDAHELLMVLLGGMESEEHQLIRKLYPPPSPPNKRRRTAHMRRTTLRPDRKPGLVTESESDCSTCSSQQSSSETSDEEKANTTPGTSIESSESMKHDPFVNTVFGGKLNSFIICDECKHISMTQEDFWGISLPLKSDESKLRKRDKLRRSLQGNFFSSKAKLEAAKKNEGVVARPPPKRQQSISLSDASESPSASEAESDRAIDSKLSRRRSFDPTQLRGKKFKVKRETSPSSSSSGKLSGLTSSVSVRVKDREREKEKPKVSKEQLAYIKRLLTEVPAPSPLAGLRVAMPNGTGGVSAPTALVDGELQKQEQSVTGLYDCLRMFTQVEDLDEANLFACENCWKIAHRQRHKEARKKKIKEALELEKIKEQSKDAVPMSSQSLPMRSETISAKSFSSEKEETSSLKDLASSGLKMAAVSTPSLMSLLEASGDSDDLSSANELTDPPLSSRSTTSTSVEHVGDLPRSTTPTTLDDDAQSLKVESKVVDPALPSPVPSLASSVSFATDTAPPRPLRLQPKGQKYILRKAKKRYLIDPHHLPPVLILHFKRFSQTSRSLFTGNFSTLKKRDDEVTFPEILDLSPFLAPYEEFSKFKEKEDGFKFNLLGGKEIVTPSSTKSNANVHSKYQLSGVVVHLGSTLGGGHYISYNLSPHVKTKNGKVERKWVCCSDDKITPTTISDVLKAKAYLLFYEKI